MTKIVLDAELKERLLGLSQPVELCDDSGRVLGRVFPAVDLSQYEPWEPPFDEAELRRREQSGERRYTTAEVLEHLERL
ncbi:MAG TPA: hypothetical protein VML55_04160 [Planctomycetaceae bacterium]|nr:hypothetical protein [Planctomycetaceae bacterium]